MPILIPVGSSPFLPVVPMCSCNIFLNVSLAIHNAWLFQIIAELSFLLLSIPTKSVFRRVINRLVKTIYIAAVL